MPSPKIPGLSGLQRRFNLHGFLAARHMRDQTYGQMDVSLEWPLPMDAQFSNIDGTANRVVLAQPAPGFHVMVLRSMFFNLANPLATNFIQLNLQTSLRTSIVLGQWLEQQTALPIINTVSGAPAPGAMLSGVSPVYVPSGCKLEVIYTAPGASIGNISWLPVTYPESQPLTSLWR